MKNKLIYILFLILLIKINTYIVLPINKLNPELELLINNNNDTDPVKYNQISNIYTTIYMGNSPYKLLVKLSPYNNYFTFTPIQKFSSNVTNYIFYNPFLSKSLHRNKAINYKEEFREVTDVFYFRIKQGDISSNYIIEKNDDDFDMDYNKENKIKEDGYNPYLYLNFLISNWYFGDNYTAVLGLSRYGDEYDYANFINELKDKSIINNSLWSVEFNNDMYENNNNYIGNLIIGEYSHIYEPKKYKKENYYKIKLFDDNLFLNNNNDWIFIIDNSFIIMEGEIRTSLNYIKYMDIIFGLETIRAPYFLFEQLNFIFFGKYFDSDICQYQEEKTDNDEIMYITCPKPYFNEKDIKLFPKIIFNIKSEKKFNLKLELNYTDLFVTKKDKVYFLIYFTKYQRQNIINIGQIFLKKYKFVFDYDNDEIGIYLNDLNIKENKSKFFYIFLIILLLSILLCYKKGYFNNKQFYLLDKGNKSLERLNKDNLKKQYELDDKI